MYLSYTTIINEKRKNRGAITDAFLGVCIIQTRYYHYISFTNYVIQTMTSSGENFFFVHHFVQRQMNHKQYYAFLSCYVSPYFSGQCCVACKKYGGYEFTKFKNINYSHMLLFFFVLFHTSFRDDYEATRTLRQLSQ